MKNIGFTGTQRGMTEAQRIAFVREMQLRTSQGNVNWHHGDCIGADSQSHDEACERVAAITIHPPDVPSKRAFCKIPDWASDILFEVKRELPYLTRNHNIVDESEELIATPSGKEVLRSGTWATIRYARKLGHPITIIYPDGTVEKENL